ncbi:uncharacterized protein LOC116292471 [Actinia tenebrosa]|uniref:Uncharacterized protein LOC116292471 n=1 Tax=Actinia tenebrosa TaxID=6105 RepID=A0A6P8HII6_ACTTE|nr:uncharacterized protein LOC116292471 [Actinia tenebrosa]
MIGEILATLFAFLVENCTGVVIIQSHSRTELQESLLQEQPEDLLEDFTNFDPNDAIFREFDPPSHLENDPQAWKQSRPTIKNSFWECLKSVLLIQTLGGSLVGFVAVVIVFLDFSTVEWCYDENSHFNDIPIDVQRLRVTAQTVEGFFIEMWDFFCIITVFPLSLIKELHLLTFNVLASFIDVTYRLYFQMYGVYRISWMSFPLNALFCMVIVINNYALARHFCPASLKKRLKMDFILSAQFILGIPVALFLVYKIFPIYVAQSEFMKLVIAAASPVFSAIPKVVSRLGAQTLKEVIHPGTAFVFVTVIYGASAIVFRVMQAELTSLGLFTALGVAHAVIDLLERITITMRDHIWEYLYRLVRGQRSRQPKYRSPRSRRFIADVSIQIMMQESTALITALGFVNVYQLMYNEIPFSNYKNIIVGFFLRASIGLLIDLVFNVLSLLIQTRVMNIAVNRVWKKKWRYHLLVNTVLVCVSILYFSGHLFEIVSSKYDYSKHPAVRYAWNCTFPSFL